MNPLIDTWKLTNRFAKWWGIGLIFLLFIAALALMTDVLTLNVSLDLVIIDDLTNPMGALILAAVFLLLAFYGVFFLLALPVVFLLGFRRKRGSRRASAAG